MQERYLYKFVNRKYYHVKRKTKHARMLAPIEQHNHYKFITIFISRYIFEVEVFTYVVFICKKKIGKEECTLEKKKKKSYGNGKYR